MKASNMPAAPKPEAKAAEAVLEQMDRLLILLEPQDAINFLNDLREALKAMSICSL